MPKQGHSFVPQHGWQRSEEMKLLCECSTGAAPGEQTDADWYRFDRAASAAGHASGRSAANDCDLWGMTVEDAIAYVLEPGEADPEAWAKQIKEALSDG